MLVFSRALNMRKSLVYLPTRQLESLCRFQRLRRSGPGGQNRNKVETGVRFYLDSLHLVGEATERRYQAENRRIALHRLRIELALRFRDVPSLESDDPFYDFRWFEGLIDGKPKTSRDNFSYPILVAEFFDVYAATDENLLATSTLLKTSPSQIVHFLNKVPKTLEMLNILRLKRGLKRLRP